MKYYINNCFFVRVTNESIEKRDMLEKMYKGEISINDFIEMNPQFLEALMNSNYLLYQLIKDNQVSENQKKTIARYFQRSIIRPTPYGLFAGITTGNFGEYTDFCRKSIAHKVSMIDSEWFYLMIKEIEETLISLEKIKLKYNNQCIISGEKIINPYLCIQNNNTDQDKTQKIIARYTEQVKRIVKLTSEWKDFKEIKEYLMEKNPEVEEKVILKFIKQLIKNEILISECRIAITEKDLLKELIKVLEQYNDIDVVKKMVDSLKQIDLLHRRYDNADSIQSIKIYGLAGAGMYLLQCDKCEKRNKILRQIINYLAGIILEEHDYKGEKVPNWFILPENHYTDNDKRYYKNGSLDFSVSHGIASIYVFMGNAYLQLIEPTICAGVMEAIENTYQMFRVSENGIYYYPGKLRWEEYKLNKTDFMNYRQSWCYGTVGIEGTFFKISCQLKKYKKSNEIYQNIIKISEKNIEEYELESPIVCHGYAGILAIFLFTYKVKPNIKLKNQIIKLILNFYRIL